MKKAILNTFTTKVLSAGLNFLIVILLSQFLGAEGKGEASLILTTIALIMIFCDFVGGASLVYLIPRFGLFQLLTASYMWSLLVCLLVTAVLYFFPVIPEIYVEHIFYLCLLQSFSGIHLKALVGKEKITLNNMISFGQVFLNFSILLFLFFILNYQSISAYLFSLYGSISIAYLLSLYFLFREINSFSLAGFTEILGKAFRYGIFNQLAHITQFLSFRISYYLISYYWGEKTLGIYSNAASIAESIWLISSSISLVQYSKIANSEDRSYNRALTAKLIKVSMLFTFTALIILLLFPPIFFEFIFGNEFGDVTYIIRGLAPGILFFNLALVVGHYFSGTGRYHLNAWASFMGLIITLITGLLLIPIFPLLGAAVTASLSYFITGLFVTYLYLKEEKDSLYKILPAKSDYIYLLNQLKTIWPGIRNG